MIKKEMCENVLIMNVQNCNDNFIISILPVSRIIKSVKFFDLITVKTSKDLFECSILDKIDEYINEYHVNEIILDSSSYKNVQFYDFIENKVKCKVTKIKKQDYIINSVYFKDENIENFISPYENKEFDDVFVSMMKLYYNYLYKNENEDKELNKSNIFDKTVDTLTNDIEKLQKRYTQLIEKSDTKNAIDALRLLKDSLALIKEYDWKQMYSEYRTGYDNHKEIAIWEQNYSGNIKNYKKWRISELKASTAIEIPPYPQKCDDECNI